MKIVDKFMVLMNLTVFFNFKLMKRTIFYILGFVFVLSSCTKLDETVYDSIPGSAYPENENQVANLSVDAYTKLKPFADDGGWWFLAQEVSSDEFCGPTRGADWYDGGKWLNMHRHTWSNDDEGVNRMWGSMWAGVTTCNQVLDMLNDMAETPAIVAKKKEVESLRALYYYYLIDNYGDVPYLTSAKNAPDLPFKAKRTDVFNHLINTLQSALPYLKAYDNKLMFNKYTAYALLAKLYINAEVYTGTPQWAKASQYCDSVISGPYTLATNVKDPFVTNNEKSPELIMVIPYDENTFKGFRLHMRTLHYQQNLEFDMTVGPWNGLCIVPTFFDTYQSTDLRKAAYNMWGQRYDTKGNKILDGETHKDLIIDPHLPKLYMQAGVETPEQIRMTGARVGKYEIKLGAKENLSNDFPLFRLTDFYLMKAECEIRMGHNGDQWVNPIRLRAGVSAWTNTGLDSLLAERGRELYVEGVRRQDLIRYGKWEQSWWEKAAHGPELRVFPIPKWATDVNSNLLLPPK